MKQTRWLMGMPITVDVRDNKPSLALLNEVFGYFAEVDDRFSTYKPDSEISRINAGVLAKTRASKAMQQVLKLCEQTKQATGGFFDIEHDGKLDPSGLVKGWAIEQAGRLLRRRGHRHYYIEAGGDITASTPSGHKPWSIGIRHPANRNEIVKTIQLNQGGVATSGTYIRGQHVYNPHLPGQALTDVVSLTVIAANVYDADRYATAAFAMGTHGIRYIEQLPGFEGYQIGAGGVAVMTSGFEKYVSEQDETD